MYQKHPNPQGLDIHSQSKNNLYKRYTFYVAGITVAAIIIAVTSLLLRAEHKATAAVNMPNQNSSLHYNAKAASSQENDIAETTQPTVYRVGIYDQKIAVFKDDEAEPFWITMLSVNALPEEDLRLLKQGLTFTAYTDVKSFLEDFE